MPDADGFDWAQEFSHVFENLADCIRQSPWRVCRLLRTGAIDHADRANELADELVRHHAELLYDLFNGSKDSSSSNHVSLLQLLAAHAEGKYVHVSLRCVNWSSRAQVRWLQQRGNQKMASAHYSKRHQAVLLLLTQLEYAPELERALLMSRRDLATGLFKGVWLDTPALISEILRVSDLLMSDSGLSRTAKVAYLGAFSLEQLAQLYAATRTEHQGRPIHILAHNFLMKYCTRPGNGVCYAGSNWTEIRSTTEADDDIAGDKESGPRFRNKVLSIFAATLRPAQDKLQRELLVAIFRAAPEVYPLYFGRRNQLTYEPALTIDYMGSMTTLQLAIEAQNYSSIIIHRPEPLMVAELLVPGPIRKALSKSVSSDSELTRLFALRYICAVLMKFCQIRRHASEKLQIGSLLETEDYIGAIRDMVQKALPEGNMIAQLCRRTSSSLILRELEFRVALQYSVFCSLEPLSVDQNINILPSLESEKVGESGQSINILPMFIENLRVLDVLRCLEAATDLDSLASKDDGGVLAVLWRFHELVFIKESKQIVAGITGRYLDLKMASREFGITNLGQLLFWSVTPYKNEAGLIMNFLGHALAHFVRLPYRLFDKLTQQSEFLDPIDDVFNRLTPLYYECWNQVVYTTDPRTLDVLLHWMLNFTSAVLAFGEEPQVVKLYATKALSDDRILGLKTNDALQVIHFLCGSRSTLSDSSELVLNLPLLSHFSQFNLVENGSANGLERSTDLDVCFQLGSVLVSLWGRCQQAEAAPSDISADKLMDSVLNDARNCATESHAMQICQTLCTSKLLSYLKLAVTGDTGFKSPFPLECFSFVLDTAEILMHKGSAQISGLLSKAFDWSNGDCVLYNMRKSTGACAYARLLGSLQCNFVHELASIVVNNADNLDPRFVVELILNGGDFSVASLKRLLLACLKTDHVLDDYVCSLSKFPATVWSASEVKVIGLKILESGIQASPQVQEFLISHIYLSSSEMEHLILQNAKAANVVLLSKLLVAARSMPNGPQIKENKLSIAIEALAVAELHHLHHGNWKAFEQLIPYCSKNFQAEFGEVFFLTDQVFHADSVSMIELLVSSSPLLAQRYINNLHQWLTRRFAEDSELSENVLNYLACLSQSQTLQEFACANIDLKYFEAFIEAGLVYKIDNVRVLEYASIFLKNVIAVRAKEISRLDIGKLCSLLLTSPRSPLCILGKEINEDARDFAARLLYDLVCNFPSQMASVSSLQWTMRCLRGYNTASDLSLFDVAKRLESYLGVSLASQLGLDGIILHDYDLADTTTVVRIEPRVLKLSVSNFPCQGTVMEREQLTYDPDFILSIMAIILYHDNEKARLEELIESDMLGFAIMCVSSAAANVRSKAMQVLSAFLSRVFDSSYRHKDQITLAMTVFLGSVESFREPGATEHLDDVPRAPAVTCYFFRTAIQVGRMPGHWQYETVNRFLLQRSHIRQDEIPLFHALIQSGKDFRRGLSWLLDMLMAGLRDDRDFDLYQKHRVFEFFMAVFDGNNGHTLGDSAKARFLEFLAQGQTHAQWARQLGTRQGLVSWLSMPRPGLVAAQATMLKRLHLRAVYAGSKC